MNRSLRIPLRLILRALVFASVALSFELVAPSARAEPLAVTEVALSSKTPGTAELLVSTSAEPHFLARVADGGLRLIVDIDDADVGGAKPTVDKGNLVVASVLTQAFAQGHSKTTRVLITLAHKAEYRVRPEPNGLRIDLRLADATAPMTDPLPQGAAGANALRPDAPLVGNVRFEHQPSVDRVVIDMSAVPAFSQSSPRPGQLSVELSGVRLREGLQRKLDVSAFGGPMHTIATYRRASDPSRVVVEVDGASEAKGTVSKEGTNLVLSFATGTAQSTQSGIAADGGTARKTRTVAREVELIDDVPKVETTFRAQPSDVKVETSDSARADAFLPGGAIPMQQRYAGKRADFDFKDAPILEVLRLISDVGRVNIVAGDNVTGSVTIKLRNVPWDQALETVLQAKGYGMVRQGNMIRVAPLADLNKERELAIARRKAEMQLAPIETRLIPVSYAQAKDLQERAKEMLSPRGTISVDERTNVLIIRDVAGNLNQIEELIRSLDTQTPEVLIEARIVEATSTYLRDVGIQWGGDGSFSAATGNPTGLAFPNSVGVVGGASDQTTPTAGLSPFVNTVPNPNFAVNLPATVGTGQGGAIGLSFGSVNNTVNLAVRLSAAESSGMLRIISSPRVLTLDNRDARIAQGTLIPFSQISAQGVQTTFQEAKLQLLVKPHVTAEGSVAMHVKINRDEPDFNQTSARGDPTILKREAETDLLIMDGHTAVIGGIFTRNTGRDLNQVPILGDIPVLGVLFQRRRASDTRGELVIFLTPRIVNRAEALGH